MATGTTSTWLRRSTGPAPPFEDESMRDLLLPAIQAGVGAVDRRDGRPAVAPEGLGPKAPPGGHLCPAEQRGALLDDMRAGLERVR